MAWQARIERITASDPDTIMVAVSYYDDTITDANGPVVQFAQGLSFATGTAAQTMRSVVIARGKDCRNAFNQTAVLNTAVPAGTVVAIP